MKSVHTGTPRGSKEKAMKTEETNISSDYEETYVLSQTGVTGICGFPKETNVNWRREIEISALHDGLYISLHDEVPSFISDSKGTRSEVEVKDSTLRFTVDEAEKILFALQKAVSALKSGELRDEEADMEAKESLRDWFY